MPGLKSGVSVSEALHRVAQSFRAGGIEEAEADAPQDLGPREREGLAAEA